ncbi:MAG: fumarylacetoacetate hydrolase family protein [SAR202 cluster bacterium]|nr:fumarylacetoacetate hydrolase family protein [SAR202 cluster bacterium]
MRYYRIQEKFGGKHILVETAPGTLASLTSINDGVGDFVDLLKASHLTGQSVDSIAKSVLSQGRGKTYKLDTLIEWSKTGSGDARIIRPIDPAEMWAGGLGNYKVAPETVEKWPESNKIPYAAERPAIMYKGTPERLVGPFDRIGFRADTEKTIAEGELVIVIYKGKLVGYSTGNEVAGVISTKTHWWNVPAKVFKGCASLGPCIVTPESLPNVTALKMELIHKRNGKDVARVQATTALQRQPEDLVRWTVAHDTPPDLTIMYTGGCVADGNAAFQAGDVVTISLEGVGYVENQVEMV